MFVSVVLQIPPYGGASKREQSISREPCIALMKQ
jgi:hypothetical protein